MAISIEKGIESQKIKSKLNKYGSRWPSGKEAFHRFDMNPRYSALAPQQTDHFERLMRDAFHGRRMKVVDYEAVETTWWVPGTVLGSDGSPVKEPKVSHRHLLKIEMDAWHKEDDPVLTRWQKFKLWLLRKPYPKAEEPNRVTVYYSLSHMQFHLFRKLMREDFQ